MDIGALRKQREQADEKEKDIKSESNDEEYAEDFSWRQPTHQKDVLKNKWIILNMCSDW